MNTNIVLNNTPSIVGVRVPASMTRELRVLTGTDGDTDSLRKNGRMRPVNHSESRSKAEKHREAEQR